MKYLRIYILIFLVMPFVACEDQNINSVPLDYADADFIYNDSINIDAYVNNLYAYIPTGFGRFGGAMLAAITDEAVYSPTGTTVQKWATGSWDSNFLPDNPLPSSYEGIRLTYVYQNDIDPYIPAKILTQETRNHYKAQAQFIRALLNFEILKRFGGYPLVTGVLDAGKPISIPRSNFDECVSYISTLCDSAAMYLPLSVNAANLGRVTKGAALALKSRLLLYAASPLYNNPAEPENNVYHGAYDPSKWEKAATAAAAVINLTENGSKVYALHSTLASNSIFVGANVANLTNKETILYKLSPMSNSMEKANAPIGYNSGGGGNCPTADLVEAYGFRLTGMPFNFENPDHIANIWTERDRRINYSIVRNDAKYNTYTVQTYVGGADNNPSNPNSTRTGFYLMKLMNPNVNWWSTAVNSYHPWNVFRYAEILLNYAEAMNEAYGADSDPKGYGMTARQAVKLIRDRVATLQNADFSISAPAGNKEAFRRDVQNERRIELAFEEHRYWDLRRWKLAETILNQPVHGLQIIKNADGSYTYSKYVAENRVFTEKMYYYPFPNTELKRNPALVQNKGW